MTIAKLIKELQKAQEKLGPRHRVSINIGKIRDLNVDWDYHDVSSIEIVHGVYRFEEDINKEYSCVVLQ